MSAVAKEVPNLTHIVNGFLKKPKQLLIDGNWIDAASGKVFDVIDPATGKVIAQVAEGDKADIDKAVKAARKAFESGPWPDMSPAERGKLLHKVGDLILENLETLAELESLDNGKPITVARAADVPLAADMFHYMSGWCTKRHGITIPMNVLYDPGTQYHAYTRKEPVGVVGQIIPWNFPLLMAAWKLAPALTTGCTIVLKVAEETPLSALKLGEILQDAGIPNGVVNIVTGFGETAGAALANHTGVDKIAFTGSTEVGRKIVQASASDLKKVSLELGGKSPNIVLADADLDVAITGAANAIFFNHGQCCAAGSRLFVQEKIFDQVVEGVAEYAKNIKLGHGLDPKTQMGPVVSEIQFTRINEFLQSGNEQGARALSGGKSHEGPGYFVEPTVLTNTRPGMRVVDEEIFGPVVTAMPFKDMDDELVKQANNSIYGLASGIWTRDISKAHLLASRLKAGTVWINCYNIFNSALPFGGYKQSGWGREMGEAVLNSYTEEKAVTVRLD
ncbi:MAG: aldehyde dehydrogenase family protein [Gammaproteobacteria bacterium]